MKKALLFVLLISAVTLNSFAQSNWFVIPSNTLKNFYSIKFANANLGLAVGEAGRIYKTTNGGASVYGTNFDDDYYLLDVDFATSNIAYAVGLWGKVLKSTNAGDSWFALTNNASNNTLYGVSFLNEHTGVAVGQYGTVIRTTNGGASWTRVHDPVWWDLFDVEMLSSSNGVACGSGGKILRTTNGGTVWFEGSTPFKFENLWDLDFVSSNSNIGYICGDNGIVIKTTNGGIGWFPVPSFVSTQLHGVCAVNVNSAVVVGNAGTIIKTNNGGSSFSFETNPAFNTTLYGVDYSSNQNGLVVGGSGTFLRSTGGVIGIDPVSGNTPDKYSLSQNYPNPFNPATKIRFTIPSQSLVTLKVYNMVGQEVVTLVNRTLSAGIYETDFNGSSLNSGVYFYTITADGYKETKKMLLIK